MNANSQNTKDSIVLVCEDLQLGGVERAAAILANRWSEEGYQVHIVTFEKLGTQPFFSLHEKTIYWQLGDPRGVESASSKSIFQLLGNAIKSAKLLRGKIKSIKQQAAGSVFVIGFLPHMNIYARLASFKLGVYCIGTEHLYPTYEFVHKSIIGKLSRWFVYKFLDQLVVVTKDTKAFFLNLGIKKTRVIPHSHSHPSPHFDASERKEIILSIGRLEPQKRFDRLIDAFAPLSKKHPHWNLLIVGNGSLKNNLLQKVENLGLNEKIKILPGQKEIQKFYDEASVFAMASDFEGFSLVTLEAMKSGLPVVHTNCLTGPSDIIENGKSGILVPLNDNAQLSAALERLIANEKLRILMGQEAKERAKAFDWTNISKLWKDLFRDLKLNL